VSKEKEPQVEYFQDLLDRFKIKDWDMCLIGDGSGSKWGYPIGWGVTAVFKADIRRKVFYGAMNDGTVNIAEAMAYLQPLLWFLGEVKKQRKESGKVVRRTVHIITDSEYVRQQGSKGHINFSTHQPIWAVFDLVKRQGVQIEWHWAKRDDVTLNMFADVLSKRARKQIKENEIIGKFAEEGINPSFANPWE
jgi:ribonuclease HI